jgi:hypothetical protein
MEGSDVIRIGPEEQLFLDDYLIERTENIIRRVNQATKHDNGPVLTPGKPWEGTLALLFGTVLYDDEDDLFKMWYYCPDGVAYATSSDGVHWRKPELDVIVRDGEKTNLVIERGNFGHFYEFFGALKDIDEPDQNRRYKAGFVSIQRNYSGGNEAPFHRGQRRGLGTAISPDGVHWTLERDFTSYEICDISRFFRDKRTGRFILFGRTKLTRQDLNGRWRLWGWGRAVTRIESRDFREWTKGEIVLAADGQDPEGTEIYSMSVFPYAGIYVGCVQIFRGLPDQGNLHIQLAVSRDCENFIRVEPREPFIPEGHIGGWDRFNISLGNLPPVTVGDELWFYYSGRSYRHSPYKGTDTGPIYGAIGLAKIKRGRFIALEAGFDKGMILTKPLIFDGTQLLLNADAKYGSIEVSLLGKNGNILPGYRSVVSGKDNVSIPVVFDRGCVEKKRDIPLKIRFKLENAQIFGFQIK